jgi:hypothetical protein
VDILEDENKLKEEEKIIPMHRMGKHGLSRVSNLLHLVEYQRRSYGFDPSPSLK